MRTALTLAAGAAAALALVYLYRRWRMRDQGPVRMAPEPAPGISDALRNARTSAPLRVLPEPATETGVTIAAAGSPLTLLA